MRVFAVVGPVKNKSHFPAEESSVACVLRYENAMWKNSTLLRSTRVWLCAVISSTLARVGHARPFGLVKPGGYGNVVQRRHGLNGKIDRWSTAFATSGLV